jgi:ABC-type proline/glycine betaine transport system permease subunit
MEGGVMEGSITARTLDHFGWLVAASVFALVSAVVTAICIKYEERWLAWVWAAAFFSCALAAAYFLGRML